MRYVVLLISLAAPVAAAAQPPPSDTWRVTTGYDTFKFRDAASSTPRVDGSPVRWRGTGPAFTGDYLRERPFRLHRFGVAFSTYSDFVYDTGIGEVPRPEGESARMLEGRYDYHRYFAKPIFTRALQAGIGVRGAGERRVLRRQRGGLEMTDTSTAASIAIVAALRVRPTGRLTGQVEWSNAGRFLRGRQQLPASGMDDVESWGGGWFTELDAQLDVRITTRAALIVAYDSRGEGWLFDHRSYSDERRRLTFGVAYGH